MDQHQGAAPVAAAQPSPPAARPAEPAPARRVVAAFGSGSGAAWVISDLASI